MSYLLIEVANREHTPYGAVPPNIVGPFASEADAEQYAAELGMGQGHDDYGGCRSVCVVRDDLSVTSPDRHRVERMEHVSAVSATSTEES